MSYIVSTSWDAEHEREPCEFGNHWLGAIGYATELICMGEYSCMNGTVTIIHDGEVIREYKVGGDRNEIRR